LIHQKNYNSTNFQTEKATQSGYCKLKLMQSPLTEHILVYFITLDEDGVLSEQSMPKKARAIVEVDTDNCYVLTEKVITVSDRVKTFDKLIGDLETWFLKINIGF
ncbi:MAG: BsaWI family type II restriction enzyme, partial [Microcystaceae cyanobacterium]